MCTRERKRGGKTDGSESMLQTVCELTCMGKKRQRKTIRVKEMESKRKHKEIAM